MQKQTYSVPVISADQLRLAAEQKLSAESQQRDSAPLRSTDALLHELHVHKIELEMQNETLREAQTLLEISRDEYRNRFVDLFDFAPLGYLTLNNENLITEINLTAAAMLGVERVNLMLRRFPHWIATESQQEWNAFLLKLRQQGGKQSCELLMQHSDNAKFYVRLDACIVTSDGSRPSMRIALTNITAQKRNQQLLIKSQQQYAGIVESAMDAIITVDKEQRILLFNPAAEKLFGCPAAEAVGSSMTRFIPNQYRQTHDGHLRNFAAAGTQYLGGLRGVTGLRANGEEFPIEVSISQTGQNDEKCFTAILRDISERKRMEARLDAIQRENNFVAELIRNSDQPIGVGYKDGSVFSINAAFEELTGYSARVRHFRP